MAHRAADVAGAIERLLGGLAALLLAALLVILLTAVAARYLFGSGLIWADELAIWLHLALIAAGYPLVTGSVLAMRLEVLVSVLPAAARRVAAVVADGFIVHASLVLIVGGAEAATLVGGSSTVLGVPEWWRMALLPAGAIVALILFLGRARADGRVAPALASLVLGAAAYAATRFVVLPYVGAPSLIAGIVAAAGLLIGAPLPHVLIAGVATAIPFGSLLPEPAIVQNVVTGVGKFLLLAIPCFLLAGGLLTTGGLGERLVRLASALVGHLRGGLAQTTLLSSVLFSGASGSSIANAAFGAKVMVPALIDRGYPRAQAGALVAATAMLDNIIPPSIAFLILAAATNLSVGQLLVGGLWAGLLLAAALAVAIHLVTRESGGRQPRADRGQRGRAFLAALPALGLGVVVVVGIRFGVVTTTEAAALAAGYALVACLALRSLGWRTGFSTFREAAIESAAVGLLIGASAPFAFLLAVDRVAEAMTALVTGLGAGPIAVMLVANLILLAAGLVLDIGAAILLLAPLLLPAAVAAGIDPIHFGVVLVVNLMIHGLTPPFGILVYVVGGITRTPPATIFRAVLPLLAALLCALAVIAGAAAVLPHLRG